DRTWGCLRGRKSVRNEIDCLRRAGKSSPAESLARSRGFDRRSTRVPGLRRWPVGMIVGPWRLPKTESDRLQRWIAREENRGQEICQFPLGEMSLCIGLAG